MREQNISLRLPIRMRSRISWRIDCGAYGPVKLILIVAASLISVSKENRRLHD